VVHFDRVGRRPATPLERLVEFDPLRVAMRDGLVYVLHGFPGCALSVYDVRRPEHPRRVGHYAAAHELPFALAPLADHRVLLGWNHLHVVGPPRLD